MTQAKNDFPEVDIYTDGACGGNPGKGGCGAILRYRTANGKYTEKELSCGYLKTTNNRMELLAAITALEMLKRPCNVTLYSDSRYLIDAVEKGWLECWIKKNWIGANKKTVKNVDLWKRLINVMHIHRIKWVWVKGHNGNIFNERCDRLAVAAYGSDVLAQDEGYL